MSKVKQYYEDAVMSGWFEGTLDEYETHLRYRLSILTGRLVATYELENLLGLLEKGEL